MIIVEFILTFSILLFGSCFGIVVSDTSLTYGDLMSFSIKCKELETGIVILELNGEITFENSDILRNKIDELCDAQKASLIIDLAGLKYMSSAGMGVLVHGLKRTRQLDGKLCLVNLNSKMRRVFLITQFTHHFNVYETMDKAITSFEKVVDGG